MVSTVQPLRRVFRYARPYWPWFALGLGLAVLINASELAAPYIIKIVIDDYLIAPKATTPIATLGLIFFAVIAVEAICAYAKAYTLNYAGQRILHDLRLAVFSHLQHLPLAFFDKQSSGRLVTRVTNDIEALNELYTDILVRLFQDVFLLVGIVLVMVRLSPRLTLISAAVVPVIVVVVRVLRRKTWENFRRVRHLIGRINGFIAENIAGMKIAQIFAIEQEKFREFLELNHAYRQALMGRVLIMGLFWSSAQVINNLAICVLLWVCIPDVLGGALEIGVLFAFITYVQKIFGPINHLSEQYATVLSAGVSAQRIFEILDTDAGLEDLRVGAPLPEVRGHIEFRKVWFAYEGENWVLKDISFTVQPGEMTAFVGATGSGKTTIMNLLTRFYDIQRGEILLDDVNIRAIPLRDLRRCVAVVMQDVFLFAGDITSNIRLNNTDIPPDAVIAAARYVNAHGFITQLPNGYHEAVKERGATLSAGQRQLLAFARAITFQPTILVLDEATANIDTTTELIIQDSLSKIARNRTMLVVAHRLSTIQHADAIIVMHKGRIREVGTHAELLARNGLYSRLYALQYAPDNTANASVNA
jgi:ATP-binding cassette, subfamily B, multidrug efflux pump